ncbi:MAG: hypothetical protein AAB091_04730, partial [Elusimicrobiota bacterium]
MLQTVLSVRAGPRLYGRLKLAHLLEMPEREFGESLRQMESSDLFRRLHQAGVVSLEPYHQARLICRRFNGWELRQSVERVAPTVAGANNGFAECLDGQGNLVQLIQRIGQERFEECFLREKALSIEERAQLCGISISDANRILDFVNRLYIQTEFENRALPLARDTSLPVFSAVAGI